MRVEGGCHCGRIAFVAEVDPDMVSVCHCTDCQTLTGSGWRVTVFAPAEHFALLSGQPKIYVKTAESGRQRVHGFCADCGTPIYSTTPGTPKSYGLRVGTIRQRAELPPKRQIWCRSALPWSSSLQGLEGIERE